MKFALPNATALVVAIMVPLSLATAQPVTTGTVRVESLSSVKIAEAAQLMDMNGWSEAIDLLNQVIAMEPSNALAHANRAICYASTNRLEEAERDLAIAEAVQADTAINHRVRALLANRRSDDQSELAELAKSLALEPGNPFSNLHLVWRLQSLNRESEALAAAQAFNAVRADLPDSYLLMARILNAQREQKQAATLAPAILAAMPGSRAAMMVAAEIYQTVGNREQAIKQISQLIGLDPETPFLYRRRAEYRSPDDVAGRRADLEEALKLEPGNLDSVTGLAQLDFQERRWTDALAGYSAILAEEPKDFGILTYRAMANDALGRIPDANRDLQAAIAASSGAGDLYRICHALGHEGKLLDRVLAICEMANTADPDDSDIFAALGLAKLRLGRLDEALTDYTRSLALDDRSAGGFYGRALVRWRSGDRTGALQDRGRARAIEPLIDDGFRSVGLNDLPN